MSPYKRHLAETLGMLMGMEPDAPEFKGILAIWRKAAQTPKWEDDGFDLPGLAALGIPSEKYPQLLRLFRELDKEYKKAR